MLNKGLVWFPVFTFAFVLIVIGGYVALTQGRPAVTASGAGLPMPEFDEMLSQDRAFVGETGFSIKRVEVFSVDNRTQGDSPIMTTTGNEETLSEETIRGRWAADKSKRRPSLDLVEAFTFSDTRQPNSPVSIDGTLSLWQGERDYIVLSLEVAPNRSADHLAQHTIANTSE